jgi:tRNA threonylcarbamoyladenosine biosynthesis protein TsaB
MFILTVRTDKPEAEIGLYQGTEQLVYVPWPAHRELAETIHLKLRAMLDTKQKDLHDVEGIVFYKGPGSFTGLRIGASVANALAEGTGAAIIGSAGEQWIEDGIKRLLAGEADKLALPEYGAAPHITAPRK